MSALYVDTSVALRATLEEGTTPDVEQRIGAARLLLTSRLSLLEAARALIRAREVLRVPETQLVDVERSIAALWNRCEIWEISVTICDFAARIAPRTAIRTLDALHLATYLTARRRIEGLELLTVDDRLAQAAASAT
jgi:predicted nucleic acid-binding protein